MAKIISSRRNLLIGLGSLLAAPAIVRASSLMPVKAIQTFDPDMILIGRVEPFECYIYQTDVIHCLKELKRYKLKWDDNLLLPD